MSYFSFIYLPARHAFTIHTRRHTVAFQESLRNPNDPHFTITSSVMMYLIHADISFSVGFPTFDNAFAVVPRVQLLETRQQQKQTSAPLKL